MRRLVGNMGIGHVRYPTAGSASAAEAQPFYVNSPYGIALAHNGNLTNTVELSKSIFKSDLRHINTNSDSEVLLNVFAHELQRLGQLVPSEEDIFYAVRQLHRRCLGGYAVIAMITGIGIMVCVIHLVFGPYAMVSENQRRVLSIWWRQKVWL